MAASAAFARVRQQIEYAYENVSFVRDHMTRAGVEPCDLRGPDDLRRVPPTRKPDYRRGFPARVIAAGYGLRSRHVRRFTSSGTDGDRLVSVAFSYDLARRQATCLEFNDRFGALWRPGLRQRTCRLAAPACSDVECSTPSSSRVQRLLPDGTLVLPVYHDLLTTPRAVAAQALDELAAYDPHLLFADPTHLAFLVRAMRALGGRPHRREGFCIASAYTLCTQVARRQIRECYGPHVPLADMLGMSEIGYLGLECPEGRMHINSSDYYLEFVCGDQPAETGKLAELIITTLEDELSPRIRYATGDLYRLTGERCPCGSSALVVSLEGRARNMLCHRMGIALTPRELDDVVGPAPWIDLYQMSQDDLEEFTFRYLPNQARSGREESDLRERLCDALGTDMVRCIATPYIPADRGGKFLSCVSSVARQREWSGAE